MTLEELARMLEKTGFPFAYDHFAEGESTDPPFICYLLPGSDNFAADGSKNRTLHGPEVSRGRSSGGNGSG